MRNALSRGIAVLVLIGSSFALAASAPDADIDQKGIRFSMPAVTVRAGGVVRFHNHDDVTHNIMVIDADDMPDDQGLQKPGEVITAHFPAPGTYQVRCAIHPKMKMTVTVER